MPSNNISHAAGLICEASSNNKIMEDNDIKSLFAGFKPDMGPDFDFMARLEQRLDSVEFVKQQTAQVKARCRRAVVFAALAGFVAGFLCSLLLPYLQVAVANWQPTLPDNAFVHTLVGHFNVIAWLIIALTSIIAALNTYELSLALSSRRRD